MRRKQRTLEELREASDHLHYEVSMFLSLTSVLAERTFDEDVIKNATLESFAIHIRAIMDFLYPSNPRRDDVLAEDFFDSPEQWWNIQPQLSELLKNAKRRADKEVVHLTFARLDVTDETKPWSFIKIAKEIMNIFDTFIENVPKDRLGENWQQYQSGKSNQSIRTIVENSLCSSTPTYTVVGSVDLTKWNEIK